MKPEKVPVPHSIKDTSGALLIECYSLNDCGIVVQRVNVADQRSSSPDFRWKIEIAHSERHPDLWEIQEARELVDEAIHMAMIFPRAGFHRDTGYAFHLWEVKDENLTDQVEFESVNQRRQDGDMRGGD